MPLMTAEQARGLAVFPSSSAKKIVESELEWLNSLVAELGTRRQWTRYTVDDANSEVFALFEKEVAAAGYSIRDITGPVALEENPDHRQYHISWAVQDGF